MKALLAVLLLMVLIGQSEAATNCTPTRTDSRGPFYKPDARERSVLGTGYVLKGTVRSSVDCISIPEARIEVWHAGPDGKYTDAYRATLISNHQGQYRLQTDRAPGYSSRPPHIHLQVTAPGYHILITQYYPQEEVSEATFDLVLVPVEQ